MLPDAYLITPYKTISDFLFHIVIKVYLVYYFFNQYLFCSILKNKRMKKGG
jgi:hypothetical protein